MSRDWTSKSSEWRTWAGGRDFVPTDDGSSRPRGKRARYRGGFRGRRGSGYRRDGSGSRDGSAGRDGSTGRDRSGERGGRGGRGRPPPGLKGRDIGLWYRDRSLGKKKEVERKTMQTVNMDSRTCWNINHMLSTINHEGGASSDATTHPHTSTSQDPHSIANTHATTQSYQYSNSANSIIQVSTQFDIKPDISRINQAEFMEPTQTPSTSQHRTGNKYHFQQNDDTATPKIHDSFSCNPYSHKKSDINIKQERTKLSAKSNKFCFKRDESATTPVIRDSFSNPCITQEPDIDIKQENPEFDRFTYGRSIFSQPATTPQDKQIPSCSATNVESQKNYGRSIFSRHTQQTSRQTVSDAISISSIKQENISAENLNIDDHFSAKSTVTSDNKWYNDYDVFRIQPDVSSNMVGKTTEHSPIDNDIVKDTTKVTSDKNNMAVVTMKTSEKPMKMNATSEISADEIEMAENSAKMSLDTSKITSERNKMIAATSKKSTKQTKMIAEISKMVGDRIKMSTKTDYRINDTDDRIKMAAKTAEIKTETKTEPNLAVDDDVEVIDLTEDIWENDEEMLSLMDGVDVLNAQRLHVDRMRRSNPALDQRLIDDLHTKQSSAKYQQMLTFRQKLPAYNMREEIVRTIASNQVVVLSGETGCGKTTQVPQYILDDYINRGEGSKCSIVCTQPRRISAVSVAQRVSEERAERCGEGGSCGYLIRLENKFPRQDGSILFCTTGCLLKFMENDPQLWRASHIILDEIHERDVLSDFLIIILKSLLVKRPDVKVILMSATLNAEMFSTYFNNCPMLNIPGYTFPVKRHMLEDILEMTGFQIARSNQPRRPKWRDRFVDRDAEQEREYEEMEWRGRLSQNGYSADTIRSLENFNDSEINFDLILAILKYIMRTQNEGAVLVFLPGWTDISKLNTLINSHHAVFNRSNCLVIPLHSMMPTVNQREVFNRPPHGIRKIVIATNIAETSITIDDVVYVIDCGKIKVKDFVPEINLCTLLPQWVSRANATQRSGRAGRVQAGVSYHLFTSYQQSKLQDYLPAEMLRSNLEELCLQIKLLKLGGIEEFISQAIEPPPSQSLKAAIDTLRAIKAMDSEERLTALGHHLARMPLDPHTGKMILFGAMFCCLDPILTVAASLSFKDAFTIPLGREKESDKARGRLAGDSMSDHIMLINAFKGWEAAKGRHDSRSYCWDNFLSENTLRLLSNMKNQFAQLLQTTGFISTNNPKDRLANINSNKETLVKAIVCAGLYPKVAKLKGDPKTFKGHRPLILQTQTDRRVTLHLKSVNVKERRFKSCWFVYHKKLKTNSVCLHDCSSVSTYPLLFFGGDLQEFNDDGLNCVKIDNWIVFRASQDVASSVKALRTELDKVLETKIKSPGVTVWSGTEGVVLQSIIDLIMSET